MNERQTLRLIFVFSALVFIAVVVLYQLPRATQVPSYIRYLPALNATINATCTLLLMVSFWAIRGKRTGLHKRLNISAFVLSSLFLVSYVWFHSHGIETRYPADHPLRPLYFFILITHIILAAVVLPMVLLSFYRGLQGDVVRHRRIARWSFPVWLYVTVTGVIVYLMISPHYKF